MVEIRSYQPEFLDKQVEIGEAVIGEWTFGAQSKKEQLQNAYSQDGFDPETRLYAFKNGEMVGFLPSSVQAQQEDQPLTARLELPLTLQGHEDARKALFEKAVDILKSKGVKTIRTRAGPAWGYTGDFAKENGFSHSNTITKLGSYSLAQLPSREYVHEVRDFNIETDIDLIASMFKEFYSLTDEQVEGIVNQLKSGAGVNFVTHKIIVQDNKIVGRLTAYTQADNPEILVGTLIAFEGDQKKEVQEDLIHAVFSEVKSQGHQSITATLSGPNIDGEEIFSTYDINFEDSLSFYEMNL